MRIFDNPWIWNILLKNTWTFFPWNVIDLLNWYWVVRLTICSAVCICWEVIRWKLHCSLGVYVVLKHLYLVEYFGCCNFNSALCHGYFYDIHNVRILCHSNNNLTPRNILKQKLILTLLCIKHPGNHWIHSYSKFLRVFAGLGLNVGIHCLVIASLYLELLPKHNFHYRA